MLAHQASVELMKMLHKSLAAQETALRESGVMASLIAKHFDPESFLQQIRRAHAR